LGAYFALQWRCQNYNSYSLDGWQRWLNVPILNSEQMYLGMKRLGRETQLVVYPDEYHGLKRPSFLKDRMSGI
jgi:hypothetical protein